MYCSKCGFENPEGAKFCNNCGTQFIVDHTTDTYKDERRNIWGELADDSEAVQTQDDDKYISDLEMKFADGVEDWDETISIKKPAFDFDDDIGCTNERVKRAKTEKPAVSPNKVAKSREYYDTRRSGGAGKFVKILLIAFIVLFLVGAILALSSVFKNCSSAGSSSFSSCSWLKFRKNEADNDYYDPETMDDGLGKVSRISGAKVELNPHQQGKYYIIVPADEGNTLIYEGTSGVKREHNVSAKGNITFDVYASDLLPTTPIDSEFYLATPTVFRVVDGVSEQIDIPPVKIEVPRLSLTGLPDTQIVSEDGQVSFGGKIATPQNNATITVDTLRVIDGSTSGSTPTTETLTVGADGSFTFNTNIDRGEYVFEVKASLGGYKVETKRIQATINNVLTPDQVIVVAKNFVSRALNVEESIRVYGAIKADKGSVLTVYSTDSDFSLKSEPVIDADNNFSFEVNLPEASKIYRFVMKLTLPDGKVFERPFSVERPPQYNDYVPTVWSGTYDEMSKPIHTTDKRGFLIKGTVDSIIYDGDYILAKFTLEDGHIIEIEYHDHYSAALKLEAGNVYTLYGFSLGTADSTEGLLRVFIWFATQR
ncbi:MAG: zinc ribbon domain-containing protein [Clostridia bacterium]|nr:zinc ribbon domain-containing protein [Clostridia bacterium]